MLAPGELASAVSSINLRGCTYLLCRIQRLCCTAFRGLSLILSMKILGNQPWNLNYGQEVRSAWVLDSSRHGWLAMFPKRGP